MKNWEIDQGKVLEYRGEEKHYTIFSNSGDIIAKIQAFDPEMVETVTLPAGAREVGFRAFKECPQIKRVICNDGLRVIDFGSLWGLENLEEIHLSHSVRMVSPDAFPVRDLNAAKVKVHVDYVAGAWQAVRKANWLLRKIPMFEDNPGLFVAMKLAYERKVELVVHVRGPLKDKEFDHFPADCQVVLETDCMAKKVFMCSAISKVTVGQSVKELSSEIFDGGNEYFEDTSLQEICVEDGNVGGYYSIDGVLFKNGELIRFPQQKLVEQNIYKVPCGTRCIVPGAFNWAYGIEQVFLPRGVKLMCGAFANMPKLEKYFREEWE